jgi:hypothetical protein
MDGALLFEHPESALHSALATFLATPTTASVDVGKPANTENTGAGSATTPAHHSIWAVHPKLSLQKWCYQRGIPWFILGEGLHQEIWRWPITSRPPSLLVVRYQPVFPFSLGCLQLKLAPLFELCQRTHCPMILDRQELPYFVSEGLNLWLKRMGETLPYAEVHTLPTGVAVYGALLGRPTLLNQIETYLAG